MDRATLKLRRPAKIYSSAAGLAIPHVVKFGCREFAVTGDKWMATCQKCNKHVQDNARVTSAFTKYKLIQFILQPRFFSAGKCETRTATYVTWEPAAIVSIIVKIIFPLINFYQINYTHLH